MIFWNGRSSFFPSYRSADRPGNSVLVIHQIFSSGSQRFVPKVHLYAVDRYASIDEVTSDAVL